MTSNPLIERGGLFLYVVIISSIIALPFALQMYERIICHYGDLLVGRYLPTRLFNIRPSFLSSRAYLMISGTI